MLSQRHRRFAFLVSVTIRTYTANYKQPSLGADLMLDQRRRRGPALKQHQVSISSSPLGADSLGCDINFKRLALFRHIIHSRSISLHHDIYIRTHNVTQHNNYRINKQKNTEKNKECSGMIYIGLYIFSR